MNKTIEEQVIEFCVRERSIKNKEITEDSTLFGDLGIYGDDADEFFYLFAKEFDVDISELDLSNYFPSELSLHPETLIWFIRRLFLRGTPEKIAKKKTIKVKNLIETAKNGKWESK